MGELSGATLEDVIYEGFGPGNAALLVEALTENRNRTAQSIKSLLQKFNGTLGAPGSVGWMFERRGIIRLNKPVVYGDAEELNLIELGVDDIIDDGDELVALTTPEHLTTLKEKLTVGKWGVLSGDIEPWPRNPISFPEGADGEKLTHLLEALEDNEDVQNVATTAVL